MSANQTLPVVVIYKESDDILLEPWLFIRLEQHLQEHLANDYPSRNDERTLFHTQLLASTAEHV